jgi:hypothetical protein
MVSTTLQKPPANRIAHPAFARPAPIHMASWHPMMIGIIQYAKVGPIIAHGKGCNRKRMAITSSLGSGTMLDTPQNCHPLKGEECEQRLRARHPGRWNDATAEQQLCAHHWRRWNDRVGEPPARTGATHVLYISTQATTTGQSRNNQKYHDTNDERAHHHPSRPPAERRPRSTSYLMLVANSRPNHPNHLLIPGMKIYIKVHPIRPTNHQPRSHPDYQVPQWKMPLHTRRRAGIRWRTGSIAIELHLTDPPIITDEPHVLGQAHEESPHLR